MNVCVLTTPYSACDAFILQNAEAKISHTLAWSKLIEEVFGQQGFYLIALEGCDVHGVLPLTQVRSRLFGNRMISQAFSNYGGPLADGSLVLDALYNRAVKLAIDYGCDSIVFHNLEQLPYDLVSHESKISMYLPLVPDPDELWRSFKPKVRNQVRKAIKAGFVSVSGHLELLDDFYHVWTIRMSQLGTPCYPRRFFDKIIETFPENARIFLVRLGKLTVGGAFVYCFKGFVQIQWAATLIQYNKLCPNNLIYWSVMKHYCLAGASCFDFGRTTVDSSHHKFKKQWGSYPVQLYYQYWTQPGCELSFVEPENPKYRKKIEMWKKLPLWMTRFAGPYFSRSLP